MPSSIPSVVEAAKGKVERHQAEIANHHEMLSEAFRCFERGLALDPNNVELIGEVADCYSSGQGVQEDKSKALAFIRKGAELGDPKAQTALGYIYSGGLRGGPDNDLAAFWFRKASEQEDAVAANALLRLRSENLIGPEQLS